MLDYCWESLSKFCQMDSIDFQFSKSSGKQIAREDFLACLMYFWTIPFGVWK